MFDRNFIKLIRSGDEGTIFVAKDDIMAFCDNADEQGIIEGSTAVYLKGGLAYAVNHSVEEVVAIIKATEVGQ